jgi:hypothetical protein
MPQSGRAACRAGSRRPRIAVRHLRALAALEEENVDMRQRRALGLTVLSVWLVACDGKPASQVSPLEGEGEVELASVTRSKGAPDPAGGGTSRGAVEAWTFVVDQGDATRPEAFGLVTASGALDGTFGIRFDLADDALLDRAPLGRREPRGWAQAIVAHKACAQWNRDGCFSVAGTRSEGITFHAKLDADLPVRRIRVVDATRDPLEGISVPFEGRRVGVQIERNDPSYARPLLIVRYLSGNRVLAGFLEPPFDDERRTIVLSEGAEAVLDLAHTAFERSEISRGTHRAFEREMRRALLGIEGTARMPTSEWHAYYALSRTESGKALPIHVEPGSHAIRRVTLVRVKVEDRRVSDVVN